MCPPVLEGSRHSFRSFSHKPTFLAPAHHGPYPVAAAACPEQPATGPEPHPAVVLPWLVQPARLQPSVQPTPSQFGTGHLLVPEAAADVKGRVSLPVQ